MMPKKFYRYLLLGLILFLVFLFVVSKKGEGIIIDLKNNKRIAFSTLVDSLKDKRVIFIGELHDIKSHHDFQLKIINALNKKHFKIALGLEMFQARYQDILDGWIKGTVKDEDFIRLYYDNWKFPWSLYRDIFYYAKENRIPLVAMNIPPEISKKVGREGFNALTEEELGKLPPVTCNVDPEYEEFIRRAMGMHMRGKDFKNFCEAQMLWDSSMAWYINKFLQQNQDYKIMVLVGSGHAWKPAIPRQLISHHEYAYTVILPSEGRDKLLDINFADYLY